jgi:hypothetical protein
VGPPPVLVSLVLGQDEPQVPLAEDQHLVGDPVRAVSTKPPLDAFARGLRGGIFAPLRSALAKTVLIQSAHLENVYKPTFKNSPFPVCTD